MKRLTQYLALAFLITIASCASAKKTSTEPVDKDGSSFSKAVPVKSVSEEYAYVRKVCPGCQFKSQSLRSKGKKYYDLLFYDNGGTEVVYYFDINSFYGKMF